MTNLILTKTVPASSGGTTTVLLTSTTSYENLVIQLTNLGATASTCVVQLIHNGVTYPVSPSAIALTASGGNLVDVTLPALNPGETLQIKSTSTDNTDTTQVLVWAQTASKIRS